MAEITYGNTITLPNGNTLSIPHIYLELNERNRVVMQLETGWVFYNLYIYPEGTATEDICYFRYGVYPADYNFDYIVVANETTVNADQNFTIVTPTTEKI